MILIIGATGSVGSRVVQALRARGATLRLLARDPAAARARFGDGVEIVAGDLADPTSVRQAMRSAEGVFLATGNHPDQVTYEKLVIDTAAGLSAQHVVKVSALGAAVGSELALWDWHGQIEAHLAAVGVPATILQPAAFMTNLFAFADSIRGDGKIYAPAGQARVAMVDPRDIAEVAAVALTESGHVGQTYPVTGRAAITYTEVATALGAALGRDVTYVPVPDEGARQGMVAAGLPDWLAAQLVLMYGFLRAGAHDTVADTVLRLTGRLPCSIAQFAQEHRSQLGGA